MLRVVQEMEILDCETHPGTRAPFVQHLTFAGDRHPQFRIHKIQGHEMDVVIPQVQQVRLERA
jgi:hypothetical protein